MKRIAKFSPGKLLSIGLTILAALAVAAVNLQAACTPPPSGLVAWWQAEGNANDFTGAHNGALSGSGATYAGGRVGQGFRFDGTNGYVAIPDSAALKPANVTVEAWVWLDPNVSPGTEVIVFKKNSWSFLFEGYNLAKEHMDNGNGTFSDRFSFVITSGGNQVITRSTTVVQRGVWYHVAGTYDGSKATIWVNGAAQASNIAGFALDYGTRPVFIGATGEAAPYDNFLAGIIDEASIYSRALATNEIAALYSAGSAGKCASVAPVCVTPPSGLISWWPGEGSATDVIGGNTGTWAGTGSLNSYGSGMVGQEFVFDGTHRDRVSVGSPANLQLQNFTIEAWIKRSSSTVASLDENFQDGTLAGPDGVVFGWGDGGYSLTVADDGKLGMSKIGVDVSYAPPAVTNTNWHHVAVTKSGTQLVFYVDGVTQPSPTINPYNSIFTFTTAAAIGSRGDGGGNTFYGKVDELSIYNRALSANEITAIYNAGSAGKCATVATTCTPPASGIVGWWPAEANANDIAGTNHGTLQGGLGFAPGEVSQAFNFNPAQSGTAVFIPASSILDVGAGAGFTLETWIKPTDVTHSHPMFEWNDLTYWGVHFNVEPGPGQLYANIPDSGGFWHQLSSASGVVVSNVFQHVALTYDKASGLATIYRNGQMVAQQNFGSFTPRTAGRALYLGRRPAPSGEQMTFAGAMDEPAVYNRALSSNEIAAIYLAGSAGKCMSIPPAAPAVPAISSFAPAAGTNGTVVTISGTNFSATAFSNIVYFGAVKAMVLAASSNSLTVTVPAGSTFAPITATVGGLTGYSGKMFEPTFTGNGSNITSSSFAPSFNLTTGNGPQCAVIADLDGDGRPDIALPCGDAHVIAIFRNIGTNGTPLGAASFAPRVDLSLPTNGTAGNPYRLRALDLDGDGKLDLVVCEVNGNRVVVFRNVAAPGTLAANSFETPFVLFAGNDCRFATAADLDADGRVDMVALNYGDKTISIFKNIGGAGSLAANSFAPPVVLAAPGGPYDATLADLDGDGKPDLAVANPDNNTVSIYQNLATAGSLNTNSFAARRDLAGGTNPETIAAVDLDGDGRLDLAVGSVQSDNVNVYRNIHAGGPLTTNSFAPQVDFGTPGWMHTVSVADFNGDGKPDLGVVGELGSYMAIFQNTSTPGSFTVNSFAPRVDFGTGWNPWGIAAGDLDGDGRPDIVFCNQYDSNIQIYQNAVPFGAPPPPPPSCTPPASGLVGWWPGEGNASDNVGTNHALLFGGATYAAGKVGQGFRLDGTNSYLQIPDSAALKPANLTVEAWVWFDPNVTGARNEQVVFKKNTWNAFFEGYSLLKEDVDNGNGTYTGRFSFVITSGGNQVITRSTSAIQRGVWYHVAATYDGSTQKLFVNGVLEASAVAGFALDYDTQPLFVGSTGIPGNYVNYLAGIIDEPSIYNRALATNEIAAIYNAGSAGKCGSPAAACTPAPANLVAWLRAEGNLSDSAGTNTGTQSGGVAYNSGEAGQGFYFNGSSQIKLSASPGLNVGASSGLTLETWIRPGHFTLYEPQFVFEWNDGAGNSGVHFTLSTDHGVFGDGFGNIYVNVVDTLGNSHGIFTATNVLVTNALQHVAFTYDKTSGNAVIYVNGLVLASTNLGSFTPQTSYDLYLANRVSGPFAGSYFNGQLDEPSIYNRALSVSEIQAIYNAGSAGKCVDNGVPPVAVTLLNVDFDGGDVPQKTGFAAAGISTNDFWNYYTRNDGNGGWRTSGSLTNLKNADGSVTAAGLTVNNAPGSWGSASTDFMYAGYIYPFDGGNVTVTITNLPAGTYDVLPYSPNGNFDVAVGAMNYGTRTCIENPVVNPPVWQPGVQYVRFTNVVVNAGQPLVLTVHPGVGDSALIAGLQIALSSLTNALPPPPVAPAIMMQPTNVTVLAGNPAVFSITAQGSALLTYQWRFNGTNIAGATGATLTLSNVQPALAGNYSVLVSNFVGTATSSNAVLNVLAPPTIISQTPSQVVLLGNPATFSVTAGGTAPLSYFWSRNSVLIPGATNFFYTLNNAQFVDSGKKFSCLVSNAYGLASSTNSSLKVINTISNDLCSGAVLVTSASYTNMQTTAPASSYGDPLPGCVDGFGNGVWYQFTAPVGGLLAVDTYGSDFDTGLAIYTGGCGSLAQLDCNDDTDGVTSALTIPTTAGVTYYFLIGGYNAHVGNLVFHLNHFTPPAFDVQPTNISVVVSSNGNFSATLSGSLPMRLQWYFNSLPLADGGRISGVTNSTLNIANVLTNDGGNYFLVASNFVGVTTSSVAVLTPIILPPFFLQQPLSQSILIGSNVTFTAVVDGTPPYAYQWNFNGNPLADDGVHITGAMTPSLSISNLTTADAGSYTLTVTNVVGSTNTTAVLTVLVPPSITLNPVGRSVPSGLPTTFNASASGIPTPSYQWQLNGTNIPGATGLSYSIGAVGTNNLGFYHLVASNSVGVAVSADAQLTFGPVAAWGRNLSNESLPPPNLSDVIAIAGTSGAGFAVRTNGRIVAWGGGSVTNVPANATNIVAIASSGNGATATLRADGIVVGWNGAALPPLSNVVSVAVGNLLFGVVARADGTVAGWGATPYSTIPAGLNQVTAVAGGQSHSLALRSNGTVAAWGTGAGTNVPVGLANVTAIAAGYSHSLALKSNGTVVAWGSGKGTNLPSGLTNIAAISASTYVSGQTLCLAVRSNGTVVAWGDNLNSETNVPAAMSNLVSIAVAAAPFHGLALVNDGGPVIIHPPIGLTAYTGRDVTLHGDAVGAQPLNYQWLLNGTNIPEATNTSLILSNIQFSNAGSYQLFVSNSVSTAASLPAPVNVIVGPLTILTQTTASPTNLYQGGKFTVGGVTVQGSGPLRYQWFFSRTNNNYAAISGATNDTLVKDPALALDTGNYYVAISNLVSGITSAPVAVRVLFAKAWGYAAVTNPPVNVTNAVALATGSSGFNPSGGQYFALGADGRLTSWANNSPIYGETNVSALSNSIVTAIAAGNQTSLALKSDGTVYAWGYGGYGQTNSPANLNSVVAIACGGYHDLALKADGTVVGWGASGSAGSQFNYGQATNNPAATNVVAIAAGSSHSLALRADGTVVGWGASTGLSLFPATATNLIAIAAGSGLSLALRANGTVVEWGTDSSSYPVPQNLSNVVAISGSSAHFTALKNDGTVVTWGYEFQTPATNYIPTDLTNVIAIASGGDHDIALFGTRAPAFTVQPWNRSVATNTTVKITLTGKCAGVQPVSYQWLLNGTNLPGATGDSLILTNQPVFSPGGPIQFIKPGTYQLVASNAYGVAVSKPAKITAFYPLGDALDTTDVRGNSPYNWITTGNAQWFGQTAITHDGIDAARSGGIGGSQETIMQTTLGTNTAGTVTFWWKVSSEQFFDTLEFRVNGAVQAVISGEVDWTQASIPVAAGTNVLMWRYSKDGSFDSGFDAGFVDQFAFASAPVINVQPAGVVANLGQTVLLTVSAAGVPQLGYQWRQNGNAVGGNSSVLTLNNVARAQDGIYSVTVTNSGGMAVSSNALVQVLVPQLLGTPVLLPDGTLQLTSTDANGGLLSPADLANFEAQASTNLVNWTTLPGALSLTNGMLQLQDAARTNFNARYYRILEH